MAKRNGSSLGRWVLFFLILGIGAGLFLAYHRKDAAIYQMVLANLERKFPELAVRLDSVSLVETRGIRLRGLELREPTDVRQDHVKGRGRLLLDVDEIFIEVPITFRSLTQGRKTPNRIVLHRPTLHLYRPSSDFSTTFLTEIRRLRPKREEGEPFYPIEVVGGGFSINDEGGDPSKTTPLVCPGIDLAILPPGFSADQLKEHRGRFPFETSPKEDRTVAETADGADGRDLWRLEAEGENSFLHGLKLHARLTRAMDDWTLAGSVAEGEIGPALIAPIIPDLPSSSPLTTFQGKTRLTFQLQRKGSEPSGVRYDVAGEIFQGNILLSLLDYPVTDLFLRYRVRNEGIEVSRMTGRSGPVLILADYGQVGYGKNRTAAFRTRIEEFPLNNSVLKRIDAHLPEKLRNSLETYSLSATAGLRLDFVYQNGKWAPKKAMVACRDLSFQTAKIPWRFDGFRGTLSLDESENLSFSFESNEEGRKVRVWGEGTSALTFPVGRMEILAKGIPLDEKFLASLPDSCRQEIGALHPTGIVDAHWTVIQRAANHTPGVAVASETANDGPALSRDYRFILDVRDGAVRYDRFPFPITQITGQIRFENDRWSFVDFQGSGGSAEVKASGGIGPVSEGADRQFALNLRLDRLPLGDEFRAALVTPYYRDLIDKLHLRGRADADVRIRYRLAKSAAANGTEAGETNDRFQMEFEAYPAADQTSIQPEHFPYEMRDLDGVVIYRRGEVTIPNLRGKNGPMSFSARIGCRFDRNGSWTFELSPFTVDQLHIDHQLQNAIPTAFLPLLDRLKLSGYFNTAGTVSFRRAAANAPIEAVWDVEVIHQQNVADFGIPVTSLCGRTRLRGLATDSGILSIHGEMDLDSLCAGDIQVTRLSGPFYCDGRQLLLGSAVPAPETLPLYQNDYLRRRLQETPFEITSLQPPTAFPSTTSPEPLVRGQSGGVRPVGFQTSAMTPTAVPSAGLVSQNLSEGRFAGNPSPRQNSLANLFTGSVRPTDSELRDTGVLVGSTGEIPPLTTSSGLGTALTGPEAALAAIPPSKAGVNTAIRPMTGAVFHGQMSLDGIIYLNKPVSYQLGLFLKDARLDEIARDLSPGVKQLGGKITARVSLQGEGKNLATLKGNGGLSLREADLYELPQIMKIFQILSVQEPDRGAFNSSSVDFTVFGHRLCLNRVILEGDALTLFGEGWLTIEGKNPQIELLMNSRLGKMKNQIPVVSEVLGGAGDQIAKIRIEGPLSDPSVRPERFPGIKKAWWSVFPDSAPEPAENRSDEKRKGLLGWGKSE